MMQGFNLSFSPQPFMVRKRQVHYLLTYIGLLMRGWSSEISELAYGQSRRNVAYRHHICTDTLGR